MYAGYRLRVNRRPVMGWYRTRDDQNKRRPGEVRPGRRVSINRRAAYIILSGWIVLPLLVPVKSGGVRSDLGANCAVEAGVEALAGHFRVKPGQSAKASTPLPPNPNAPIGRRVGSVRELMYFWAYFPLCNFR
jgi:hypothetical protein